MATGKRIATGKREGDPKKKKNLLQKQRAREKKGKDWLLQGSRIPNAEGKERKETPQCRKGRGGEETEKARKKASLSLAVCQ